MTPNKPLTPRKSRIKAGTALYSVPQTRDEASSAVDQIGAATRELRRIEAAMNDELADIKARYEALAEPYRARVDTLTKAVQTWAEAHRDELTQHGKVKTHALPAGEILWRLRPPSVRITGVEAVLDLLRRTGLDRFIRQKEEVNREAILNEPEAVVRIPGIAISQLEDFVVVPFEVDLVAAGVAG